MRVELLNYTKDCERLIAVAAKQCYSGINADAISGKLTDDKIGKFVAKLANTGHTPIEHAYFTFAIEGISRACYDKETEIMTNNGWKKFQDITDGEIVLTLNADTQQVEMQKINEIIAYRYTGILHKYENRHIDLLVTPNHNLFIQKVDTRKPSSYQLLASQDLKVKRFRFKNSFSYNNPNFCSQVCVPGYSYLRKNNSNGYYEKKIEDLYFEKENFTKFLAFYLSEGNVIKRKNEGECYQISIAQADVPKNTKTRQLIVDVIKKMGFTPKLEKRCIKFHCVQLGKMLETIGISGYKKFPYNIFEYFDHKTAKIFIDTYLLFDGTLSTATYGRLFTSSKQLADDLQTVAYIAGLKACVRIRYADKVGQTIQIANKCVRRNFPSYVINLTDNNCDLYFSKGDHGKKYFWSEQYDDYVYCVNVPNHIIFVRRNGKACWCGNCMAQLTRHRLADFNVASQRYINHNDFEYVTPDSIAKNDVAKLVYDDIMKKLNETYKALFNMGVPKEDARFVLPNACTTRIVCTMNARSLMHFFNLRCCARAQWEIREIADEMLRLCKEVAPNLFSKAGPHCVQYGVCLEENSCGRINTLSKK